MRGKGHRILDADNLYACLKPVLDGLVDAGWLHDDSPRWCQHSAAQAKDNALGPAVIVELLEDGAARCVPAAWTPAVCLACRKRGTSG